MYVTAVPNRNSPPAILLREGYRENGKVKTRTLANITHWKPERIEALKRALKGHFDSGINADEGVSDRSFGAIYVVTELAKRLGIAKVLGDDAWGRRALFLVVARVIHQGSRLSAVRWADDHAVREVLGILEAFDEDDLYQTLDWLDERKEAMEEALYQAHVQRHGRPPTLILYDVTSTYLEGVCNELGRFGYNRDKKRGKLQIVIGLMTSAEGEPLAVHVFEGNASDPTTVGKQVSTIKERFGIEELVFVGDRGMVKGKQKTDLSLAGLRYITALTHPQIRKLIRSDVIQMDLFDSEVQHIEHGGVRLVLRRNEQVQRKEEHRRQDKLFRLQKKVEARNAFVAKSRRAHPEKGVQPLQTWLRQHKLHKFVSLKLCGREIKIEVAEEAREDAALLDGCYVVETDVPASTMPAEVVDTTYRSLQQVEADFRLIKTGFLEVRPIFLRKANRTRAHVFIAMLALKIVRTMHHLLSGCFGTTDDDRHTITVCDALGALGNWCYVRYALPKMTVLRLPQLNERQTAIFEALQIAPPKKRSIALPS